MSTKLRKSDMWAVVPVKCLQDSKTRLAPVLDRVQRAEFTLVMLHDVLGQLVLVKNLAGVCVLSDDESVIKLARQLNVRIWSENASELNSGLQAVTTGLAAEGSGVMIIPCDVPAARTQDYQQLLDRHHGGATLVAASADGGTNAFLCDAGLGLSFYYGPGSFDAHLQEVQRHGIVSTVMEKPRIERDIDCPGDLDWLVSSNNDCRARDYLLQLFPATKRLDWKQLA